MVRVHVDAAAPDADAIERVARLIRRGAVIAIPTDTLYGLAADPGNPAAVERIFAIKGRQAGQALPLVAADRDQVVGYVGALGPLADRLAVRFWPGPLTLVVAAPPHLAPGVTGGTATVGIRVPAHAVTRALCAACAHPITATSANRSGEPATELPDAVVAALGDRLDGLVDAGATAGGAPSTLVDTTGDRPRLLRSGAISWDDIERCLQLEP